MWLGPPPWAPTRTAVSGSSRSWTIRSPRSVSTTSTPRASKYGFSPHSSVSIDFDLTRRRAPAAARMSATIRLCSSASRAQCTVAPFAVAAASNCSRVSASRESVCSLIPEAISRSRSTRLGHPGDGPVPLVADVPERGVVPVGAGVVGREPGGTRGVIDRLAGRVAGRRGREDGEQDHAETGSPTPLMRASAGWTNGSACPPRRASPSRCIAHETSVETTASAPWARVVP